MGNRRMNDLFKVIVIVVLGTLGLSAVYVLLTFLKWLGVTA